MGPQCQVLWVLLIPLHQNHNVVLRLTAVICLPKTCTRQLSLTEFSYLYNLRFLLHPDLVGGDHGVPSLTELSYLCNVSLFSRSDLVDGDHCVPDVVEGDLPISIHIQDVKGLLGFLRLQEVLQVLSQNVGPAECNRTLFCKQFF